jgi:hypothetical protein
MNHERALETVYNRTINVEIQYMRVIRYPGSNKHKIMNARDSIQQEMNVDFQYIRAI